MKLKRLIRRCFPVEYQPPSHAPNAILAATGYFRFRTWLAAGGRSVPGNDLYRPLFSPWFGDGPFQSAYKSVRHRTLVSPDRCYILWQTLHQAMRLDGHLIECGVFRGGTALLASLAFADAKPARVLHLFDSFQGMPPGTAAEEGFSPGDFSTTSLESVTRLLAPYPSVQIHAGFIPDTFAGVDCPAIAWAHVDVDLYQSVHDCIQWIYPRLVPGGFMIFDDYGFPSCPGARRAVDEAMAAKPESPICLPTGQCLVIKLPAAGKESR